MKVVDLMGQKFGKLVVIEFAGTTVGGKEHQQKRGWWKCQCECGNVTTIDSSTLRRGKVIGCGKCRSNIGNQYGKYDLKTYDSSFNEFFRTTRDAAKRRGLEFFLTQQDVKDISKKDCHYCGCAPHKFKRARNKYGSEYVYNGIDRVNNERGYVLDNCVPCCEVCNRMKLTLTENEFKNYIKNIYYHWAST